MRITGTIVHNDIEGGFWGIVGDDGAKYRPVDGLPEAVQTDGLRVEAEVEPVTVLSFAMWGRSVRLKDIQPL